MGHAHVEMELGRHRYGSAEAAGRELVAIGAWEAIVREPKGKVSISTLCRSVAAQHARTRAGRTTGSRREMTQTSAEKTADTSAPGNAAQLPFLRVRPSVFGCIMCWNGHTCCSWVRQICPEERVNAEKSVRAVGISTGETENHEQSETGCRFTLVGGLWRAWADGGGGCYEDSVHGGLQLGELLLRGTPRVALRVLHAATTGC